MTAHRLTANGQHPTPDPDAFRRPVTLLDIIRRDPRASRGLVVPPTSGAGK